MTHLLAIPLFLLCLYAAAWLGYIRGNRDGFADGQRMRVEPAKLRLYCLACKCTHQEGSGCLCDEAQA